MISGIPKLLGRGFLVGFILPTIVHYALAVFVLIQNNVITELSWEKLISAKGVGPSILIIVVVAVLLMALNKTIVRLFEGYPIDQLFSILKKLPLCGRGLHNTYKRFKLRKFKTDVAPIIEEMDRLENERKSNPGAVSSMTDFQTKSMRAIAYFPDQAEYVLPTKFGNAMRAFEVYSRVVYGLESIQGWSRLSLILPKRVLEQLQESRMPLDFNINMITLSLPNIVLIGCIAHRHGYANLWWAVVAAGVSAVAWISLPGLAVQWGEMYKSVFDVNRGKLAKELGLRLPRLPSDEREMWRQVSRAMVYRRSGAVDLLVRFRQRPPNTASSKVKDKSD